MVLIEKIMRSQAIAARRAALLHECVAHGDCTHVSMDGIIRPTRRIMGQEDYRVSKTKRNEAPIGDEDAVRRMLSMRSRTGAVLAIAPLTLSEKPEFIANALKRALPPAVLSQVQTIAFDAPTHDLFVTLKRDAGMSSLRFLTGDPTHVCFTYESTNGRTQTGGARVLRTIQSKFNKIRPGNTPATWGPPHLGEGAVLSAAEERVREKIRACSMPLADARRRLSSLDGNLPYLQRIDYMRDMAALCAVYRDEVVKKTAQAGAPLSTILWRATKPTKVGYYFNHLRRLAAVPERQRPQLSSGTTAVEVLNKEINNVFRHVQYMYQSTLILGCEAFAFSKLLTHNVAEYCPTDIIAPQSLVLAHNMAAWGLTDPEWQTVRATETELRHLRWEHRERIAKKPAKRVPRPREQIKRHTFNKKRVR